MADADAVVLEKLAELDNASERHETALAELKAKAIASSDHYHDHVIPELASLRNAEAETRRDVGNVKELLMETRGDVKAIGTETRKVRAVLIGDTVEEEGGLRGEFRKHQREAELFRLETANLNAATAKRLETLDEKIRSGFQALEASLAAHGLALAAGLELQAKSLKSELAKRDRIGYVVLAIAVLLLSPEMIGAAAKIAAKLFLKAP